MSETIHYVSPFTYIRDMQHLRKHIKYITREQAKPLSTLFNRGKMGTWIERGKIEKAKRHDAVIALKFVLAIPQDKINDTEFFNRVGHFLKDFFNLPLEHVDLTIHRDNPENPHIHVLIYPRNRDNKKLRINKNDLKNFHKKWDEFLSGNGYTIRRDDEEERIGHLGWRLHADPQLQTSYHNYKKNKKQKRQIDTELKKITREEKELTAKIQKIEYRIKALEQQIEQQRRKQKKAQKYKIRTMNKRFLFVNILSIMKTKQEIKRIEKREREAREKMLLLDAILTQLRNQRQILEREQRRKEEEQRQFVRNKKMIIFETKLTLVEMGKQFYELERESIKDLERKEKKPVIQHQEKPPQQTIKPQSPPTPPKQTPPAQPQTSKHKEENTKKSEEERIKEQVFGYDTISITRNSSTKPPTTDQQVIRKEQTEADIKWILFGIEPEPDNPDNTEEREERPPEEKPFRDLRYIDI